VEVEEGGGWVPHRDFASQMNRERARMTYVAIALLVLGGIAGIFGLGLFAYTYLPPASAFVGKSQFATLLVFVLAIALMGRRLGS